MSTTHDERFEISLYIDSYKSTGLQWNEKCKNYIQLDQLKKSKWQRVDSKEIWKCYKIEAKKIPDV